MPPDWSRPAQKDGRSPPRQTRRPDTDSIVSCGEVDSTQERDKMTLNISGSKTGYSVDRTNPVPAQTMSNRGNGSGHCSAQGNGAQPYHGHGGGSAWKNGKPRQAKSARKTEVSKKRQSSHAHCTTEQIVARSQNDGSVDQSQLDKGLVKSLVPAPVMGATDPDSARSSATKEHRPRRWEQESPTRNSRSPIPTGSARIRHSSSEDRGREDQSLNTARASQPTPDLVTQRI